MKGVWSGDVVFVGTKMSSLNMEASAITGNTKSIFRLQNVHVSTEILHLFIHCVHLFL